MKRPPRGKAAPQPRSRRFYDILGLALTFTGFACLLWLFWRDRAAVSDVVVTGLRLLAGSGAFIIPVVLIFTGVMLLYGYERFSCSHATWGSILIFLDVVTWRHLAVVPDNVPVWDTASAETFMAAGGYLGATIGSAFSFLFGSMSYVFLVMIALMSLVLVVDRPFVEMLAALRKPAKAGVELAKNGVARVKQRGEGNGSGSERPSLPAVKGLPGAPTREGPAGKGRPGPIVKTRSADTGSGEAPPPQLEASVDREAGAVPDEGDSARPPSYKPYVLPPGALLKDAPQTANKRAQQELAEKIKILEQTLDDFGIGANVVEIAHGPTVTRYEVQLAPGIQVGRIVSLADTLAYALAAINVRVEAPIPGKSAIGVEVPNSTSAVVSLKECVEAAEFKASPSKLLFALGKDVAGELKYADLAKMPHLLIGGSTGSGKSVCLNTLIGSIVYRALPEEVKFLLIDPKRVELSLWEGIPHLMHPVVKDVKLCPAILKAAMQEMDRRYDRLSASGCRNIESFNEQAIESERVPYMVIIVDELADLMIQSAAEVETYIARIAQLARAVGIHLVIATQRPSVDVITGNIKANISSRIAFSCIQSVDSRTIIDRNGAERLIGRGDMLFLPIDAQKPLRIQGCYVSEAETKGLVEYLKQQDEPDYCLRPATDSTPGGAAGEALSDDALFEKAVRLVVTNGQASASMLQRRFHIGYARSGRLIDEMEQLGFVGPGDGAKPREILVTRDQLEHLFGSP